MGETYIEGERYREREIEGEGRDTKVLQTDIERTVKISVDRLVQISNSECLDRPLSNTYLGILFSTSLSITSACHKKTRNAFLNMFPWFLVRKVHFLAEFQILCE